METKHTPGPWTADDASYDDGHDWPLGEILIFDDTHGVVAETHDHTSVECTLANARLIASAPDLLKFCGIVDELADSSADFLTNFDDASDEMRAVAEGLATLAMAARDLIRKATGE
jgi:hypothetical protein